MPAPLTAADAVLVVVDWQERLFPAMPDGVRGDALKRAADLCWLARELDIPVVASEQYRKGLGPTLEPLLVEAPVEKLSFSAMREPAFAAAMRETRRRHAIVTGMETHICVAQTVCDLLDAGYRVRVVGDACLSRRRLDWDLGLRRMAAEGAVPVSAEAVLFELVGRAGTPLFKELSRRIK